jgi:hypothetical protein
MGLTGAVYFQKLLNNTTLVAIFPLSSALSFATISLLVRLHLITNNSLKNKKNAKINSHITKYGYHV